MNRTRLLAVVGLGLAAVLWIPEARAADRKPLTPQQKKKEADEYADLMDEATSDVIEGAGTAAGTGRYVWDETKKEASKLVGAAKDAYEKNRQLVHDIYVQVKGFAKSEGKKILDKLAARRGDIINLAGELWEKTCVIAKEQWKNVRKASKKAAAFTVEHGRKAWNKAVVFYTNSRPRVEAWIERNKHRLRETAVYVSNLSKDVAAKGKEFWSKNKGKAYAGIKHVYNVSRDQGVRMYHSVDRYIKENGDELKRKGKRIAVKTGQAIGRGKDRLQRGWRNNQHKVKGGIRGFRRAAMRGGQIFRDARGKAVRRAKDRGDKLRHKVKLYQQQRAARRQQRAANRAARRQQRRQNWQRRKSKVGMWLGMWRRRRR